MALVAIVIILALVEYMVFGALVGRARVRCKLLAPATTGNETFERYFRVHYNTLEQRVVFVPSMWIFGSFVSPLWAAGLGLIFIIGRAVYFRSYVADPAKRAPGFGLTMLANFVLLLGGLAGAALAFMR